MVPRRITFIGVPLDLGAGRRGVDMGPSAFRLADIHQKVRELGYEVADAGDMEVSIQETREPGDPRMKFLKEIRSTCEALREKVVEVLGQGGMPVVVGGDHSIAMGTIGSAGIHVSVDLDGMDPYSAPGVGTPAVHGALPSSEDLLIEIVRAGVDEISAQRDNARSSRSHCDSAGCIDPRGLARLLRRK